jgi:hypothetical protein
MLVRAIQRVIDCCCIDECDECTWSDQCKYHNEINNKVRMVDDGSIRVPTVKIEEDEVLNLVKEEPED